MTIAVSTDLCINLDKADLVNEGLAVMLLQVGEQPHRLHCSCARLQGGDASIAAVTLQSPNNKPVNVS